MRIAVLPRDANPYQAHLYREMQRAGDEIRYLGEMTRSQTANIALLPVELVRVRLAGYRVVHLHWVYRFRLPSLSRFDVVRRLMRYWFGAVLRTMGLLGIRVVWIVHNVLPHEPVFDDDAAGRRRLLAAADSVVAHEAEVLTQLTAFGALPAHRHVVRHPAYEVSSCDAAAADGRPLRILFFGAVAHYKGVTDLLRAVRLVTVPVTVTVAGRCLNDALRAELTGLAKAAGPSVALRLERLSDDDLEAAVGECDLVVLPYTRVTTSGSVLFALSAGRPVLLPAAPTLAELPEAAVLRYDSSPDVAGAIARALDAVAGDPADLITRGRAAREWAHQYTWVDLADELHAASGPRGAVA